MSYMTYKAHIISLDSSSMLREFWFERMLHVFCSCLKGNTAVGAASQCYWAVLMLLKCEIMLFKCGLMLLKCELMLLKCELMLFKCDLMLLKCELM